MKNDFFRQTDLVLTYSHLHNTLDGLFSESTKETV